MSIARRIAHDIAGDQLRALYVLLKLAFANGLFFATFDRLLSQLAANDIQRPHQAAVFGAGWMLGAFVCVHLFLHVMEFVVRDWRDCLRAKKAGG